MVHRSSSHHHSCHRMRFELHCTQKCKLQSASSSSALPSQSHPSVPTKAYPTTLRSTKTPASQPSKSRLSHSSRGTHSLPKIAIDGQNVALAYGRGKKFCSKGIVKAIEYFNEQGNDPVVFVTNRNMQKGWDSRSGDKKFQADNISVLEDLHLLGNVVKTPAGVYDDLFMVAYAMRNNIDMISRDAYTDLKKYHTGEEKDAFVRFLQRHVHRYTFKNEDFVLLSDSSHP